MQTSGMRIDKWLWNVRIFKSRTKATNACKSGAIKNGELRLKPSSIVAPEDIITVKKNGYNLIFKVNKLIPKRVNATLASPCYDNLTSEDEMNKFKNWFIGKGAAEKREPGSGRPTKRDRRELDDFKDELFLDEWFD